MQKRAKKTGSHPVFKARPIMVDPTPIAVPAAADVPSATVGSKFQAKTMLLMTALETVKCMNPTKPQPRKIVDSSGKKWKRVKKKKVRKHKHKSPATTDSPLERAQTVPPLELVDDASGPPLKRMQTAPSKCKLSNKEHKAHFRISQAAWSKKTVPAESELKKLPAISEPKKLPAISESKKVPADSELKKDMIAPDLDRIVSLDSEATRRWLAKDQENHKQELRGRLWSDA
jgi:hypothetical protein